jgi:hypothetical protein
MPAGAAVYGVPAASSPPASAYEAETVDTGRHEGEVHVTANQAPEHVSKNALVNPQEHACWCCCVRNACRMQASCSVRFAVT